MYVLSKKILRLQMQGVTKMKLTEQKIKSAFEKVLGKNNVIKMNCQRRGIPDLYCFFGPVDFWIEIKIDDDKLSKLQKDWLTRSANGCCFHFYTKKEKLEIEFYNKKSESNYHGGVDLINDKFFEDLILQKLDLN